jgi:predicted PurR-regulated permease PerM
VLSVVVVIALPIALGWRGIQHQFTELGSTLTTGLDRVRDDLVNGPLSLSAAQVDAVRDDLVNMMPSTASDLLTGAAVALEALAGVLVTTLLLFFLLRDGPVMWGWFLGRLPDNRRDRIDDAARAGWHILARYTRGVVVVAVVDAVGIGLALVLMDVPLVLPLILLTFVGGFIPYLGATLAGAAAVLVALVSNGFTAALIILAAVLAVQTLEGNLLEPLIVGRAARLHPAAVLIAVTAGGLLAGIAGAVIAVPLLAVTYRVAITLNGQPGTGRPGSNETASDDTK